MKRLLTLFILTASLHVNILKAVDALPEYTLKAAYLYNFALLTDWPVQQQEAEVFTLCLYTKEGLGSAFDALEHKKIGNKPIKLQLITSSANAKTCQLVFVPKTRQNGIEKMLLEIVHLPILLVSDDKELEAAHIHILQNNDKLIFTINTKTLHDIGLSLSSRLLNLAKEIKQ